MHAGLIPSGSHVLHELCQTYRFSLCHLQDIRIRFAAAVTRSLLPVCRDFP
ncbi:DUF1472 domain-containing protein, partial [Escherichia coli]|nr:DUF1472 domain-containing protein [Escherichia coli]NPN64496.1 DUF1472 domain-containing protein [Escherichia coli]